MGATRRRMLPRPWTTFVLLVLAATSAKVDAETWDQSSFDSSDASTSSSDSSSDTSDTIVLPSDASGSNDGSAFNYMATIQFINSHVPPDALDQLVREAHEAQQVQADAGSTTTSRPSASGSFDAEIDFPTSSSSSEDRDSIVLPPELPTASPSPTPSPTPTPTPTTDAGSSDAFKIRVIVIGVVVAFVVLAMAGWILAAWIRNPGRRHRSTSASIESLVLSPLDRSSSGILGPSSVSSNYHNSPRYFVYDNVGTL